MGNFQWDFNAVIGYFSSLYLIIQHNESPMKHISHFTIFTAIGMAIILLLPSCESSNRREHSTSESRGSNSSSESRGSNSSSDDALMERLRKKKVIADYRAVGDLDSEILTYKDCVVGDAEHFVFRDTRGAEYTFDMNSTDLELCDLEGGPSRKFIYKKFKVIWRNLRIKEGVPDDFMMMEEMKEILHLEEQR